MGKWLFDLPHFFAFAAADMNPMIFAGEPRETPVEASDCFTLDATRSTPGFVRLPASALPRQLRE